MKALKTYITEIIGLIIVAYAFTIFAAVIFSDPKPISESNTSIIDTIKTILLLITGFYFGSSKGSKDKQEVLEKEKEKNSLS